MYRAGSRGVYSLSIGWSCVITIKLIIPLCPLGMCIWEVTEVGHACNSCDR